MAFDVSKFLALTVLIAGTGAACSGTDDKDDDNNAGGESGSSTSGKAGQGNDAAGADAGGNGGAVAGGEGGGKTAGGAGAGGEAVGGGGAGGAPIVGECLGPLIVGGAGGAGSDVEPSIEGLCDDLYDSCPSAEAPVAGYQLCQGVAYRGTPGVAVAVHDCITELSATDKCDTAKVTACYTDLQGRGCANPGGEAACTSIKANCAAVELADCRKILDLVSEESTEAVTGCMDPGDENWYSDSFEGTCVERLDACSGIEIF